MKVKIKVEFEMDVEIHKKKISKKVLYEVLEDLKHYLKYDFSEDNYSMSLNRKTIDLKFATDKIRIGRWDKSPEKIITKK